MTAEEVKIVLKSESAGDGFKRTEEGYDKVAAAGKRASEATGKPSTAQPPRGLATSPKGWDAKPDAPEKKTAVAQRNRAAIADAEQDLAQARATVEATDGSLLIQFGSGAGDVTLELVESELEPPCIALTNAWMVAGAWMQELRLTQTPVAFTDGSERRLPSPPTISRIQAGGGDATYSWNEIQQLSMPPEFQGSYQFVRDSVRTALLSRADGTDAIQSALEKFGNGFTVTNPRANVARIEFVGNFAGVGQPLLVVAVPDAPEGDLTFTLSLDKAPLAAMLRTQSSVDLPLEVELGINDDAVAGGVRVEKFRFDVTIQRGVLYAALASAQGINWLRPVPKDYIPFVLDQVITGQQFYACPLGNGDAVQFVVDHNLATDNIAGVLLRENASDGRELVNGTDYHVTYQGANSLTVTLTGTAPASGALALVITAAGPKAAFQAHTHTMDQIIGLNTRFESLEQRVTTLETYIPSTKPGLTTSTGTMAITIPHRAEVLFTSATDLTKLPVRGPILLPAVHEAATTALPSPLPAPVADTVWSTASRVLVPGTGRILSSHAPARGFVASDGRMLYPAVRAGSTSSYYPTPFERTLCEFAINEKMLRVGRTLDLQLGVKLQLVNADTEAQWVLVIEQGAPVAQTTPGTPGVNLEDIVWAATPILSQRLLVTGLATLHSFGCRVANKSSGITVDRMLYGTWEAAGTAPDAANFALRARLIEFDTKNNVPDASGWLSYKLGDVTGEADATATIS